MDGVPYIATNRFVVPEKDPTVVARLVSEMESREKLMKTLPGYTSSSLTSGPAPGEFSFTQEWTTKQAYEDYMNHPARRRSHIAAGVYQYMPKDKWSVPENFTPILPTPK
ncbi:antibiotic biosynthesis monooxygenase [bacterium]|nr:antibiotic biosynthesis monooxygenase [bacterium]